MNNTFYTIKNAIDNAIPHRDYFIGTYGLMNTGDYVTVIFDKYMEPINKACRTNVRERKEDIDRVFYDKELETINGNLEWVFTKKDDADEIANKYKKSL